MSKDNMQGLDGALNDIKTHIAGSNIDPEWIEVVLYNNKQAILQWFADEVIGKNCITDPYSPDGHDENRVLDKQRDILKAAGWRAAS